MKTLRTAFLSLALTSVALSPALVAAEKPEAAPGTMGGKTTSTPDITTFTEASAALDSGPTVMKARSAEFGTRDTIVSDMGDRIQASVGALSTLEQNRTKEFKGEVRTEFKAAFETVRTREQQVRKSLDAARNANSDTWAAARSNLAADYEAYGAAVTRVETVASVGATRADARVGAAGTIETKSVETKARK